MRTYSLRLLLFAVVSCLVGCHTMRFELSDTPHEKVVFERKSFFLWGLAPTQEIDVSKRCPTGVVAVREQMSFADGLLGLLTLGFWQPISSWYYCLPPGQGGAR